MPKRRTLALSETQRTQLEQVRDRHAKAHMREKAAILLKIAAGMSPHAAAQQGGLKPHHPDTICKACLAGPWMEWYETEGLARLEVQPGRGRKPGFSPSAPE